jgi:signal transduction histidine kinase
MKAWLVRAVARMAACLGAAARQLERLAAVMEASRVGPHADAGDAVHFMPASAGAVDMAAYDSEALASWQTGLRALSHDLRAPQSAILALAELQLAAPGALAHDAFVAQAAGHAQASLRLTDNIARLLRELVHAYRMEVLELTALLREAADPLWDAAGPGPELDLAQGKVWVRGDVATLREALRLLMALALAAAGDMRPVVRQRIEGRVCRLSIGFVPGADAAQAASAEAVAMQYCRRVMLRHGGVLDAGRGMDADAGSRVCWLLCLPVLP